MDGLETFMVIRASQSIRMRPPGGIGEGVLANVAVKQLTECSCCYRIHRNIDISCIFGSQKLVSLLSNVETTSLGQDVYVKLKESR